MKLKRTISNIFVYFILGVMSVIWLAPIVWLILQSFSGEPGYNSLYRFVPLSFSLDNYTSLFSTVGFSHLFTGSAPVGTINYSDYYAVWFFNTLVVSLVTCIVSTILVLCTSYAFSRLRFKARQPMMKFILVLGMFPGFLSMIILYQVLALVGLKQSLVGLILCYVGGAGMGYFISKGFFDTISRSIDEAAMIDGASRFQIFYMIIMPLAKPIVVYTILTAFMGPWGDYILSSYILGDAMQNYTVSVGLYKMIQQQQDMALYWKQFCAGSVLVALPISLLFIFMQKFYVSGITGGAVKG
ncbi:MAG: sugar ABC transporter permease [Erysipelotrichia bacterium]|jgi:arabinogalactan oligomer/maltooligosaccharide transport system permease protein|nr:sugar ABC transporter permease [Erysipelotrichia bacterium]